LVDRDVLLVGPVPPPSGGIASHVEGLARALRLAGASVDVVDPSHGRLRLSANLGLAALRGALVHVHVCGHNPSSWALAALCAGGTQPLITVHSGLAPAYLGGLKKATRAAVAALLDRTAAIVCVSHEIAAAVTALGGERVVVATPFLAAGVRPAPPPREVLRARSRWPRLAAACVAPSHEYGAGVLVGGFARAARSDPEVGLVLFGPENTDRMVGRALAACGVDRERVTCAGELPHDQALGTIGAADLFVRPTRADGDAISVREALFLGVRVVASDAAPRPRGVRLFATGDGRALADAMLDALAARAMPPLPQDGFPALARLYADLGIALIRENRACAASPVV
jgi:glycosyltransferase involved in cell wall biosynthesis